jgi:hypothetical protein
VLLEGELMLTEAYTGAETNRSNNALKDFMITSSRAWVWTAARRLGSDAFLCLQRKAAYYDFLTGFVSYHYMLISRECSTSSSLIPLGRSAD